MSNLLYNTVSLCMAKFLTHHLHGKRRGAFMPRLQRLKSDSRKNGTLVRPHLRTKPDGNRYDNLKPPTQKHIQDSFDRNLGIRSPRHRRRR